MEANKVKALEAALSQIDRQFGKGTVMRMGDQPRVVMPSISTGSLGLDIALGIGGLPKGRICEIYGPESSGKTTLTLQVIAEAQKAGGTAAFIDAEHALDPIYAEKLGVRVEDLIMSQPDTGEQALEVAEMLVRSGAVDVPVINGLTNRTHPCQIMADVMTFEEHRGPIKGKKVVWSGDGNNVCASLVQAAGQFGFDFTFTGPETLEPEAAFIGAARRQGVAVTMERDPALAVAGADLVVTDTWVSMHDNPSTRERRHNQLRPYQVNAALMAKAGPDALFMHCLPAHRDDEVTSEVMDGAHSVVFDEAENRLHAQKAIMRWCLDV